MGHEQPFDPRIEVYLIEALAILRGGLRHVLHASRCARIVGEGGALAPALEDVLRTRPRILLLDAAPLTESALVALTVLRHRLPATRILLLAYEVTGRTAHEAFEAGACGWLRKDCAPEELVLALEALDRGHTYLSPAALLPG